MRQSVVVASFAPRLFFVEIAQRCLDALFGEERAVALDGRELEVLGDLRVGQLARLVERAALEPLGRERARRDGRAAAKGHEARVNNDAVFDAHLQLHDVATGGRADQAGPDRPVVLVELADVARLFKVVPDTQRIREVFGQVAREHPLCSLTNRFHSSTTESNKRLLASVPFFAMLAISSHSWACLTNGSIRFA
jgi:hypothetical protein